MNILTVILLVGVVAIVLLGVVLAIQPLSREEVERHEFTAPYSHPLANVGVDVFAGTGSDLAGARMLWHLQGVSWMH